MHEDLKVLLAISKRLRGSGEERVAAAARVEETLAQFRRRGRDEQLEILEAVHTDVAKLERASREASELFSEAREWAKTLELLAERSGNGSRTSRSEVGVLHDRLRAAPDSNAAIDILFRSQPRRVWQPREVTEALVAAGRHATKVMVESALKRQADRGVLKRPFGLGRGYCLAEAEEVGGTS